MKEQHITVENAGEIKIRLKNEKDEGLKIKLVFLNLIANLKIDVKRACEIFNIATPTGYLWIRQWNRGGYEGIKSKDNKGGKPPRLSDEDLGRLKATLAEKEYWTTKEVKKLLKERFGVDFSEDQVVKILRYKLKMHFSKPYPQDYRRPQNAEVLLENQLELAFSALKEKGLNMDDIALGFIDEASPQNTANTVRVWSFGKVRSIKNTTRFKANTIGFYPINGEGVEAFLDDSKSESIAAFLSRVRKANERYKAVVGVIDNFPSHRSKNVREVAKALDMYLVYLPSYSPDLNPIEHIWRGIKRVLSLTFVENLDKMKEVIVATWNELSQKISYAKGWIDRFLIGKQYYMELCG